VQNNQNRNGYKFFILNQQEYNNQKQNDKMASAANAEDCTFQRVRVLGRGTFGMASIVKELVGPWKGRTFVSKESLRPVADPRAMLSPAGDNIPSSYGTIPESEEEEKGEEPKLKPFLPTDLILEVFIGAALPQAGVGKRGGYFFSPYLIPFRDVFFSCARNVRTGFDTNQANLHLISDLADTDFWHWLHDGLTIKNRPGYKPDVAQRMLTMFVCQLCGLDYIHSRGVTHGDFKPANVLVKENWCYLADFGGPGFPPNSEPKLVTLDYFPPEGSETGGETDDVYALGKSIQDAMEIGAYGQRQRLPSPLSPANFQKMYRLARLPAKDFPILYKLYYYSTIKNAEKRPQSNDLLDLLKRSGVDCPQPPASVVKHELAASEYVSKANRDQFVATLRQESDKQHDPRLPFDPKWAIRSINKATSSEWFGPNFRPRMSFLGYQMFEDVSCRYHFGSRERILALIACLQIATQILGEFEPLEAVLLDSFGLPVVESWIDRIRMWQMCLISDLAFGLIPQYLGQDWKQLWNQLTSGKPIVACTRGLRSRQAAARLLPA
jgi:serine/threonine protein kinase